MENNGGGKAKKRKEREMIKRWRGRRVSKGDKRRNRGGKTGMMQSGEWIV